VRPQYDSPAVFAPIIRSRRRSLHYDCMIRAPSELRRAVGIYFAVRISKRPGFPMTAHTGNLRLLLVRYERGV